jgi:hypothetical protein
MLSVSQLSTELRYSGRSLLPWLCTEAHPLFCETGSHDKARGRLLYGMTTTAAQASVKAHLRIARHRSLSDSQPDRQAGNAGKAIYGALCRGGERGRSAER